MPRLRILEPLVPFYSGGINCNLLDERNTICSLLIVIVLLSELLIQLLPGVYRNVSQVNH